MSGTGSGARSFYAARDFLWAHREDYEVAYRGFRWPELTEFNSAFPDRIAVKHAHSQQNPEKDWGSNTLDAVRLAIHLLNQERGETGNSSTARGYGLARLRVNARTPSAGLSYFVGRSLSVGPTTALRVSPSIS